MRTSAAYASPRPAESRKLKALGLLLAIAGCAALELTRQQIVARWPLPFVPLLPWAALAVVAANALVGGLLLVAAGCRGTTLKQTAARRRAVMMRVLLANLLVPTLLVAVVADEGPIATQLENSSWGVVLAAVGYALWLGAWRIWRHSQRQEAIGADDAMATDPRPPVLYLRSFQDDGLALVAQGRTSLTRRVLQALRPPTAEEHMARILQGVGPVIAIGKPGEPLPELGAARLYVPNEQWQQKVVELMRRAALVVVRVGASPGVLWEIEQGLAHLPRQRVVLAVLGGADVAPELLARLRPLLGPMLDAALPQPAPSAWRTLLRWYPSRRIGGLVCFGADGKAVAVPIEIAGQGAWGLRLRNSWRPYFGPMQQAWTQVLAMLNPAWREAADRGRSRAVAVLLALAFGLVGAQWFYLGNRRRGWIYVAMLPLLFAPLFLSYFDALRFVWVDRSEFDARFVMPSRR